MRLFLYGTLLDPAILERMSGRRGLGRHARPARLPGFRRVALRGTPYPTLVAARGEAVEGLLVEVRGRALRRLSAYEGPAYRLRPLRVLTPRGPRHAHAWLAPRWLADLASPWPQDRPAQVAWPGSERLNRMKYAAPCAGVSDN